MNKIKSLWAKDSYRVTWSRQRFGMATWAFALVLLVGVMLANGPVAFAQADAPAVAPPMREVTADEVNTVAREIWCPLCSGVRLDACELKACEQMKDVIAIKLAEGENSDSIKAYFVEQYGPQVMGEPPRAGFNWLAWILPAVAAVMGGFFFWRTTQRMMTPAAGLTGALDESALDLSAAARKRTPAAVAKPDKMTAEEDEYTQKLEEELAKYG